jgi:hypothetical protein
MACLRGKSLSLILLTSLVRSDRFEGKLWGAKLNYTLFSLLGPSEIGSPLSSLLIPQGRMHFMGQVKIVKIAHY